MKDKQLRQQAAEQLKQYTQLIKAAEQEPDPLQQLPSFRTFNRGGLALQLAAYSADSLPQGLHAWVYDLCKRNMYEQYLPVWGWNGRKKKRQFTEASSHFIIAFQGEPGTGTPVAFVNYRFDLEDGAPVLYLYELQLEEALQRKGVGKFLMLLQQLLAAKYGMHAVMLTVMNSNAGARAFYSALGYTTHDSTPGYDDPTEDAGYQIMWKPLKQAAAPLQQQNVNVGTAAAAAAAAVAAGKGGGKGGEQAAAAAVQYEVATPTTCR